MPYFTLFTPTFLFVVLLPMPGPAKRQTIAPSTALLLPGPAAARIRLQASKRVAPPLRGAALTAAQDCRAERKELQN